MFESLKGTFDRGVAAVSVKSETLVETSRTRTAINAAQKNLEARLAALGERTYNLWKNDQLDFAQLEEDLLQIRAVEAEIQTLNEYLEQIKQEESRILGTSQKSAHSASEGGSFCSNCGKKLPAGSRFCDECGTPVAGAK